MLFPVFREDRKRLYAFYINMDGLKPGMDISVY